MSISRIALLLLTIPVFAGADDPNSLAAIRQVLVAKYALTTPTAAKDDIVIAGAVLVLKKSGLVTIDVTGHAPHQNVYKNGRITQNAVGHTISRLRHLQGASGDADRTFVSGEKIWVTGIDVDESGVIFTLFTDAYNDTRYDATLKFPFQKDSTPTTNGVLATVAEVFDIQPPDDSKQQQPVATGAQPAPSAPQPPQQPSNQPPPPAAPPPTQPTGGQVMAPIPPPPPPPADPETISLGQAPDQVVKTLGEPVKIVKLGVKQIYYYKDMKITFVNKKVTDVQ